MFQTPLDRPRRVSSGHMVCELPGGPLTGQFPDATITHLASAWQQDAGPLINNDRGIGTMEYALADARQLLERTPGILRAQLGGLSDVWMTATEEPGTWSPRQIVAHLIGSERTAWMGRVHHVLELGETKTFTPLDRESEFESLNKWSDAERLEQFAALRTDNLKTLDALQLTDEQLAKTTLHPEFGAVTLRQLLSTWTVHDLTHLAQITRVLAKQYREAVGPWQHYLRIVQ